MTRTSRRSIPLRPDGSRANAGSRILGPAFFGCAGAVGYTRLSWYVYTSGDFNANAPATAHSWSSSTVPPLAPTAP